MPQSNDKPARLIAYKVLNQLKLKKDYASVLLDRYLPKTSQPQRTTDIVNGVIRNLCAIDAVISNFAGCESERISGKLIHLLRIATYEIVYTPQTADYAIVNQAVEIAKTFGSKKHAAFVNALLRNITRQVTNRKAALSDENIRKIPFLFARYQPR